MTSLFFCAQDLPVFLTTTTYTPMTPQTIIFDLGGVLIDWNPRYLYRKLFTEEQLMEDFLTHVANLDWNEEQDAGRTWADGTAQLVQQYPAHEDAILAYYDRWPEMLGGAIQPTVELLTHIKDTGRYRLYGLTNWSAETWHFAWEAYEFLHWFDGIVVSGQEKMRKPDTRFYQLLLDRYAIDADTAFFIDDNARNIAAARAMGIASHHFIDAATLAHDLRARAIIA